jgi:histidine phosphotransferase ChpT
MNISELVCTRISHDLVGNIGVFANAVELLEDEDDDFFAEIKSTLKMSSNILNSRLKFFRMAFGLAGSGLEKTDLVIKTTRDYIKTLNPNYPTGLQIDINNMNISRFLMLGIMACADTIIKGGFIKAVEDNDKLSVSAASEYNLSKPKIDAMIGILSGTIPEENLSLYAPLFYLLEIAKQSGKKVKIENINNFTLIIK